MVCLWNIRDPVVKISVSKCYSNSDGQILKSPGYAELLSRFEFRRILSIGLISLKMIRVLGMYHVLLLEAEQSWTACRLG
jgi:hypothetical protein